MRILGFDTATSACSVALWRSGAVVARRFEPMARGQSERLMPMIREVLDEAGVAFADLDLLAVTRGPGAFTGLRIGLAAARGLALATGLPCLGVTTLDALACAVPAEEIAGRALLAVIDAKRADLYAQVFDAGLEPLGPPAALLPEALPSLLESAKGPLVVVGDGARRALGPLRAAGIEIVESRALGVPDAAVVCRLAHRRRDTAQPGVPPQPLYLLPPSTTTPKGRPAPAG
jgi:tRNA threonylcarbamoyladenosine biosynthesis protein TsaB